jgi:ubiquinol-cytochrome c reductase cytochrome b subunit/menaquinol-cytochrome c reductase cytochrome b/c subunit
MVEGPRNQGGRNSGVDERRAEFSRYKQDVKKEGKQFHPFAMLHDTIMSLVVVAVIIALACIWYFTSGEEPDDDGLLGPRFTEKAEPETIAFVPRPDWYFYFLFYLLRIFKWPESVVLGTVGIPTIALILLLAVPFIDRRRERRLSRRPIAVIAAILTIAAMAVLTWKGATVQEFLAGDAEGLAEQWIQEGNIPEDVRPGAILFADSGCLSCHTYLSAGSSNLGAPDLTNEGQRGRGIEFQIQHLKDPQSTTPGSQMPPFPNFTDQEYQDLAAFLEASGAGG